MPATVTVSVKNLAPTVTQADVEAHFIQILRLATTPLVTALVQYREFGFQGTTVTFPCADSEHSRKAALDRLRGSQLKDAQGHVSDIIVSADFLGITILSESHADPAFDIVFVHGLQGHAHKTFSVAWRASSPFWWPRDLLPGRLDSHSLFGRYMTFGYDAGLWGDKAGALKQSVEATAEELLNAVVDHRPKGSKRPIMFICHSLGGLVVSQAMVYAMGGDQKAVGVGDFPNLYAPSGEFIVKGIMFFGTPFKGSALADIVGGLFWPMLNKDSKLARLKQEEKQTNAMLETFENLRTRPEYNFPLRIFYEEKSMTKAYNLLVTERDSAKGYFKNNARAYPIRKNHREMCKFSGTNDEDFTITVWPKIRDMVAGSLRSDFLFSGQPDQSAHEELTSKDVTDSAEQRDGPTAVELKASSNQTSNPEASQNNSSKQALAGYNSVTGLEEIPSDTWNSRTPSSWLESNATKLGLVPFPRQLKKIRKALPGTCQWILNKEKYKFWQTSPHDTVLFVRGGSGFGKSVLARFLIENLETEQRESHQLVIHAFAKSSSVSSSPKAILRHIIFQIGQKYPNELRQSVNMRVAMNGEQLDFEFYQDIFSSLRNKVPAEIFCIIDGLDECIKDSQFGEKRVQDKELTEFLQNLTAELEDNPDHDAARVRVLFTTQPLPEVAKALESQRGAVLDLQQSDTQGSVSQMIEHDVAEFATNRALTDEIREMIQTNLTEKAGPMFQYARAGLQTLVSTNTSLGSYDSYKAALEDLRPKDINAPYIYNLQQIRLRHKDQLEIISTMLRIMVFAYNELRVSTLKHALVAASYDIEPSKFASRVPHSIRNLIEETCGALLSIEEENDTVWVKHQSVKTFFLELDPDVWPEFSCQAFAKGHAWMSKICVKFLLTWKDLETEESFKAYAKTDGNLDIWQVPFIGYSTCFFSRHYNESDKTPELNRFIIDMLDSMYDKMRWARYKSRGREDHKIGHQPVSVFLAEADMVDFIEFCWSNPRESDFPNLRNIPNQNDRSGKFVDIDIHAVDFLGEAMLHWSAWNGSYNLTKSLLARGARADVISSYGRTPLIDATQKNHEDVALLILDSPFAAREPEDDTKITCLELATSKGLMRLSEQLLKRNWYRHDEGLFSWSPLYTASQHGHEQLVRLFLREGIDPGLKSADGTVALHAAARKGHLNIVKILFENDPKLDPDPVSKFDATPLVDAMQSGHIEVVKYLLKTGASKLKTDFMGKLPLHYAARQGNLEAVRLFIDKDTKFAVDKYHQQPIHEASQGTVQVLRYLLDQGADVNARRLDFLATAEVSMEAALCVTPIWLSIIYKNEDVTNFLLEHPTIDLHFQTHSGLNLLILAAEMGDVELCNRLIAAGLDPMVTTLEGLSPLHNAALNGHGILAFKLLEQVRNRSNFDIEARWQRFGQTVLLLAALSGLEDLCTTLLDAGANIQSATTDGYTPLSAAAVKGHVSVVKTLLDRGARSDFLDRQAGSILFSATLSKSEEIIKIFLDRGLSPSSRDMFGETPLWFAFSLRSKEACQILLSHGADPRDEDNFGSTILDFVNTESPLYSLFLPYLQNYSAPDPIVQQRKWRKGILRTLEHSYYSNLSDKYLYQMDIYLLAFRLKRNGYDVEASRTGLEIGSTLYITQRYRSAMKCTNCEATNQNEPMHVCKECLNTALCSLCYAKRGRKSVTGIGCLETHTYFEFAGPEWKSLPIGSVNKEGDTVETWLAKLKEKYRKAVEEDELAAQTEATEIS